MHAMCLRAQAHIPAIWGQIGKMEICTESETHAGDDYDVWAYAHKLACLDQIRFSDRSGMFSWFHRYLDLSDPTPFGWDMGLCTQAHSVHAHKLVYSGHIMCLERSGMFSWFHRYLDLSDLTPFGWDMGLCTQAHSEHASYLACSGHIMCSERSGMISWFHRYLDLSDMT